MTIFTSRTPSQEAKNLTLPVGSNVETEPGTIDVSWAEDALRGRELPRRSAVQGGGANRRRRLALVVACAVMCACTAIAAVATVASPASPGQVHEHGVTPSAVHRATASVEPTSMSSSAFFTCPFSLLSVRGTRGDLVNSNGPLSCPDTWPALLPVSTPTATRTPRVRRAR